MQRVMRRFTRAQSAVEFALALPALVLLLVVVGDYSRVFYASLEVGNAARAGAQYGAQSSAKSVDNAGITAAAQADAGNMAVTVQTPTLYCTCSNLGKQASCAGAAMPAGCGTYKTFLDVTVTATFTTLTQWPGLPTSIPLSSTAELEVQ